MPEAQPHSDQDERTAPAWLQDACGCCAGIQWGGETPVECRDCGGTGAVFVSERDRIADYPGGPLRGTHPGRFARVKARLGAAEGKCEACKGKGYQEWWQPIPSEPWRSEPVDTAPCIFCAATGRSQLAVDEEQA